MLSERLLSLLLEFRAAGDVIIHGMKGEKMKKWIVVSGVLTVFLFAAVAVYAAGNSTWGRIKVTFEDGSADESQWVGDESFEPQVAAKRVKNKKKKKDAAGPADGDGEFQPVRLADPIAGKTSDTKLISRRWGGKLVIGDGKTKITLRFPPGAVKKSTVMTMTMWDAGALDLTIKPSMRLKKNATLRVKGDLILPDGEIGLFHYDGGEDWTKVSRAEVMERNGQIVIKGNLKFLLNHFSRYAFGSRW